jgi:subtilisin family serine protease
MTEPDNHERLLRLIVREQVGRIVGEFKRQRDLTIETVMTGEGVAYMYAADQLLVREQHVGQVLEILGRSASARVEDVIEGVKLVHLATPPAGPRRAQVPFELDRIDRALGEGIATPNHVLTVAPEAGPCPATEPEEVYFGIEPYPGARPENDGSGVRIYIADTGLLDDAASHPWLVGVDGEPDPLQPVPGQFIQPYAGHGTFVAGVARCMAPNADVFVSNIFQIAGSELESECVIKLDAALAGGYDIFNLSITTPTRNDLDSLGFEAWLAHVDQQQGVVCVAAAGNDGTNVPFWPAAFPEVVSVGALSRDWHNRATFSNYGNWVKVYAPGRDLINAYTWGTYQCQDAPYTGQEREFFGMCKWSGTSFSTPMVSGLIAARMSLKNENGQQAAAELLAEAQSQQIPGVGAILLPYGNI